MASFAIEWRTPDGREGYDRVRAKTWEVAKAAFINEHGDAKTVTNVIELVDELDIYD